jgi:hypothetical protein
LRGPLAVGVISAWLFLFVVGFLGTCFALLVLFAYPSSGIGD